MEKRKKEILVLKVHQNTISLPTDKCRTYRTRANWTDSGRLTNVSYDKLIDELYKHYYADEFNFLSFEDSFYEWVNRREGNGSIEYLTAVHYRSDYKKYLANTSLAKCNIYKITKSQLIAFFEDLVGDGSNIRPKTVSNLKTIINGAFDNANLSDENSCINPHNINIHDIQKRCIKKDNSKEVYSEEDASKLISYLRNISNQNVYFAFHLYYL